MTDLFDYTIYYVTICVGSIFGIIFLGFLIWLLIDWFIKEADNIRTIAIGTIGCLVLIGTELSVVLPFELDNYNNKIHNVASLRPVSEQISADFVLGIGHIESESYFCYYADLDNNRYTFNKIPTSKTCIIETDDIKPCVYHIKNQWEFDYYELYVPLDTISIEWKL